MENQFIRGIFYSMSLETIPLLISIYNPSNISFIALAIGLSTSRDEGRPGEYITEQVILPRFRIIRFMFVHLVFILSKLFS